MNYIILEIQQLELLWGLKINMKKSEILVFQEKREQLPLEIGGIPVVNKVKYLGMTISTNKDETCREAVNSIRRNIALGKSRLRKADP